MRLAFIRWRKGGLRRGNEHRSGGAISFDRWKDLGFLQSEKKRQSHPKWQNGKIGDPAKLILFLSARGKRGFTLVKKREKT